MPTQAQNQQPKEDTNVDTGADTNVPTEITSEDSNTNTGTAPENIEGSTLGQTEKSANEVEDERAKEPNTDSQAEEKSDETKTVNVNEVESTSEKVEEAPEQDPTVKEALSVIKYQSLDVIIDAMVSRLDNFSSEHIQNVVKSLHEAKDHLHKYIISNNSN